MCCNEKVVIPFCKDWKERGKAYLFELCSNGEWCYIQCMEMTILLS